MHVSRAAGISDVLTAVLLAVPALAQPASRPPFRDGPECPNTVILPGETCNMGVLPNEEEHEGQPANGAPRLSGDCSTRAMRGGSWSNLPWYVRAGNRVRGSAIDRFAFGGFRVVRDR